MADMQRLIEASTFLNGPYLQGDGEAVYTHVLLEGQKPSQLHNGLHTIDNGIHVAEELGRGPRAVLRAGLSLLEEHEMTPDVIAKIALSQLDPHWLLRYGSRRVGSNSVKVMVGVLATSRHIAADIHRASLEIERSQ